MATRQSNKSDMPKETRLDEDVTKPSTTAPGDGPADTTDPTERASTVGGDKAAAAKAGHLTVNAVVPVENIPAVDGVNRDGDGSRSSGKDRIEKYPAVTPLGEQVTIEHNLDTGETKRV